MEKMQKQTANERKQRIQMQTKLYDTIVEFENEPIDVPIIQDKVSLVVQFVLKAVPLTLVILDSLMSQLFEQQHSAELIVVFIVLEFWITKNYTGKKMLGYKWFFGEDQYGCQRLMFECRANAQLIDPTQPRLFWIIQFIYSLLGALFFVQNILIIPNNVGIQTRQVLLNLLIILSGFTNIFLFYIVSDSCTQRQQSLRRQIGIDYVKKLEMGSIIGTY